MVGDVRSYNRGREGGQASQPGRKCVGEPHAREAGEARERPGRQEQRRRETTRNDGMWIYPVARSTYNMYKLLKLLMDKVHKQETDRNVSWILGVPRRGIVVPEFYIWFISSPKIWQHFSSFATTHILREVFRKIGQPIFSSYQST